jgi:aryl-alcohol dehydrogenase-like predicted oxidoreductase
MSSTSALNAYYTLGRSGLRVSRLALGTMTFGTEWGFGVDKDTARALFNTYVEAGGNFFDTADMYTDGTAETWLGELIAERGIRDKAVIATKFSHSAEAGNPNAGGNGRKNILRAVEASLRRLGTDYIDLYMLHTWDQVTPVEEVVRTLDDLVRAGKVRHIALSDVPAWYAARAQTIAELRAYEPICALQLEYSLVERNIEHEFVALGTRHGMGLMVWSPLANGLLSGKYRPSADGASNDGSGAGRLEMLKPYLSPAFQRFTQRNWPIVAELEAVAKDAGRSMAQVGLNWVAGRPGVASVIVGATTLDQLKENIGSLSFDLAPELRIRLDTASAPAATFPYIFFGSEVQGSLHAGAVVATKPPGYFPAVRIVGRDASG